MVYFLLTDYATVPPGTIAIEFHRKHRHNDFGFIIAGFGFITTLQTNSAQYIRSNI